jgi:hypothetical protein
MTHEREIRAAVLAEFADAVRYERPFWGRGIGAHLARLHTAAATESYAVLVPSRPDTRWFDICFEWEIRFIRGRVVMDGCKSGAPFPSALVLMGPLARRGEGFGWTVPRGQLSLLEGVVA